MKIDKRLIKKVVLIFILIVILAVISTIILMYNTEGETNMPFKISKIMLVSTAEGIDKNSEYKWDLDLVQVNDIFIEIEKNKNYSTTEIIDKIVINNILIDAPEKGEICLYRTSEQKRDVYNDKGKYLINGSIEYVSAEKTDNENATIANQGGLIALKCVNENLGNYKSNEGNEIKHDGTMLKNIGIALEQIQCVLSFDVTIVLKSELSYKGTIKLDIPVGNVLEDGISYLEKTELRDIIFKRQ